jgi:hypothetical protein
VTTLAEELRQPSNWFVELFGQRIVEGGDGGVHLRQDVDDGLGG